MNHKPQQHEPTKARMTDLHFEAWPATGLTPNRYCFLHTFFMQCVEKAKDMDETTQMPEKWTIRMN